MDFRILLLSVAVLWPYGASAQDYDLESGGWHFEIGGSAGHGSAMVESESESPQNIFYEAGLTAGYKVIGDLILGMTVSYQMIEQLSGTDKSHGNRKGTRTDLFSPTLGYIFNPIYFKAEYSIGGDYTLAQKTSSGDEVVYSEGKGFRISLFYMSEYYPPFGLYYESIAFEKEKSGSSTKTLNDKMQLQHYGVSLAWIF